jgi:hypothetical protein
MNMEEKTFARKIRGQGESLNEAIGHDRPDGLFGSLYPGHPQRIGQ